MSSHWMASTSRAITMSRSSQPLRPWVSHRRTRTASREARALVPKWSPGPPIRPQDTP